MRTQMDGQGSEGSGDIRDTKVVLTGMVCKKVEMTVISDMVGDPCTCAVTSNVTKRSRITKRSRNGSGSYWYLIFTATVKQACLVHPEGWREEERSRRKAEIAKRLKIKLEREKRKRRKHQIEDH